MGQILKMLKKKNHTKNVWKKAVCLLVICSQLLYMTPIYSVEAAGTANDIVRIAKGEVGVSGRPNKYTRWFGKISGTDSYVWYHVFVSWCASLAGGGNMIPRTVAWIVTLF